MTMDLAVRYLESGTRLLGDRAGRERNPGTAEFGSAARCCASLRLHIGGNGPPRSGWSAQEHSAAPGRRAAQAGRCVAALGERWPYVDRIMVSRPLWHTGPSTLTLADRTVHINRFDAGESPSAICLPSYGAGRCDPLVVPPGATPAEADRLMPSVSTHDETRAGQAGRAQRRCRNAASLWCPACDGCYSVGDDTLWASTGARRAPGTHCPR